MTGFPFAIVGLDLDGTLIDSSGDLTAAINHALVGAGRPAVTREQVATMIGGGAGHLLDQVLASGGGAGGADQSRSIYRAMLAYYGDHLAVHTRPYPGAVEALDELAARGVRLAVVTNKFERLAVRVLTELGLVDRFRTVIGGDTLGPGKAKPDRAPIDAMIERLGGGRAVFVGDTSYDVEAAHNAGIPAVVVSFGLPREAVATLGAEAVIDHWDELVAVLEGLGGA